MTSQDEQLPELDLPAPGSAVPSARQHDALQALAAVTRALAALPPDADDAACVQALGATLVPALGDVCHLHAADSTGQLQLVGVAPALAPTAQQVIAALDAQAASMLVYEPLMDDARPVLVTADGTADPTAAPDAAAEHQALVRAAGLNWELALPLHGGSDGQTSPTGLANEPAADALLVVDGVAGRPAPPDARLLAEVLAALVSGWRAARELRRREGSLRARLEETALAGRELAHALNNSLTMPVGVVELLLDRGTLSADLQEMIQAAAADLATLERHIRGFQEQMRAQSSGRARSGATLPPP